MYVDAAKATSGEHEPGYPMTQIQEEPSNQVAESPDFAFMNANETGRHIQRSWSAPPIPERLESLFEGQRSEFQVDMLDFHTDERRATLPQADIWGKASREFERATMMNANIAGISPIGSPQQSDTLPASDTSYENAPQEASGFSSPESSVDDTDAHPAPGMSLIDRIQEDFPRTPSPVFSAINGMATDNQLQLATSRLAHLSMSGNDRRRVPFAQHGLPYDDRMWRGTYVHPTVVPHDAMAGYTNMGYPVPMLRDSYASSPYSYSCDPSMARMMPNPAYQDIYDPSSTGRQMRSFSCNQLPAKHEDYYGGVPTYQQPVSGGRNRSFVHRRRDVQVLHPVAHSYTSQSLLDEFRSSGKSEKWELASIKGHLLAFARDQGGSRFIQQKLEKASEQMKNEVFEELFPNALMLMTDVFGNYVIQKLFEHGSATHQKLLVEQMKTNMISLALQVYGCRVIQKAVEVTHVSEQLALIGELRGHVMKCVIDQNGNHVLQKCIEAASWKNRECGSSGRVSGRDIQFIIDAFVGHVAALSKHAYGCRVIQRVLEHCECEQIGAIYTEIIEQSRDLVKDQFGNYVVQHVISHGGTEQRNTVMALIFPEIPNWSQHKYASNVVETCLDHATKQEIAQIIELILRCDDSGASCALLPMMKHMYGNYVVQKLLDRAGSRDRQKIVCVIRHNAEYLKRFTYGKHVLGRLERQTGQSFH
ncbi:TPA: hypothetical protein N0F65_008984 [Lagenidium giganteum]|uniref:PUM-HD domain-containing protein n=1 Tax=Lagenidium giganteum TaxID=4803 RepID=A0AAV2YJJ6_9STRA|nr:TPA: hypothetical protein N0F65_008984 [Lagenidium giganteum]